MIGFSSSQINESAKNDDFKIELMKREIEWKNLENHSLNMW